MEKPIVIVDYEMGNVHSVHNALLFLGQKAIISNKTADINDAKAIILPGVGAYPKAMENLKKLGLIPILKKNVLEQKKPFLGICLGMQLLADSSNEGHFCEGLGWIKGTVEALESKHEIKIPHVGWNDLMITQGSPLFTDLKIKPIYYFDHSYHFICNDTFVSSYCDYGARFVASIQKENIFATQFHPEKSQKAGSRLLANFIKFAHEV